MWHRDSELAARLHHTPDFIHKVYEAELVRVDVLDQMRRERHFDALVRQGPGEGLHVMHDVNAIHIAYVHSHKSRLFVPAATDVQEDTAILFY
jgi:hypothetical protein